MPASIPGEDTNGVYKALDYLIGNTATVLDMELPGHELIDLQNRRVIVLGGGDTAMDCVRTAVRQGAGEVYCLYRRDRDNMPGSPTEVSNAVEEGVQFRFNVQALEIVADKDGGVIAIKVVETRLGPPDESGRKRPQVVEGSETLIETDAIIVAYGFRASPCDWFSEAGITTDQRGRVVTGGAMPFQTSNPKVFAAGDMERGADLVVTAIADAMQAARSIVRHLRG
jgi:glutamate synthase (NADPH/NADH) small chain